MGLSNKREEMIKNMPKIEFHVSKSKDGKFLIHKTTFTDIKPFSYYQKVIESPAVSKQEIQNP